MPDSDVYRFLLEKESLSKAFREHFDALLTEPMPLWKLAEYFDCDRKLMATIARNIDGAVRCGKRWRIPLRSMPPLYHLQVGLIPQE